jgi:hypothetical protein
MSHVKQDKTQEKQAIAGTELDHATRLLLQNLQLRPFLLWLLGQCGIYRANLGANSSIYLTEGQRSIGLQVIDRLNAVDPTAYPTLMLEAVRDELARRAESESGSKHASDDLD